MKNLQIHDKRLPVPSFFQVLNFGGGAGDKSREIVYADITENTPALFNYYYVSNDIDHLFQSPYFDDISSFATFGDVLNHIREDLIGSKNNIYSKYPINPYDFNSKVLLLDSGAANIVKYTAEKVNYDTKAFFPCLLSQMYKYYDYADRTRFDIVIGFDLGGKYSFRDGETHNEKLISFYESLDKDAVNKMLLEETVKYIKSKKDFFPCVMATIHGKTPIEYANYTKFTLELERKHGYEFWGFALGGIASYKSVDASWSDDFNFKRKGFGKLRNAFVAAKAIKIVHSLVGDRPIHALGCGGYPNITLNYFFGATSFDAATPARRVGDGNDLSTEYVFHPNTPSVVNGQTVSFSKMFVGGYNADRTLRAGRMDYVKLCDIADDCPLCGCAACKKVPDIHAVKSLYAAKRSDEEAFYFSKQIMNAHAVLQHRLLCEIIADFSSFPQFKDASPSILNTSLEHLYRHLQQFKS